jgi:hypothetical protein
MDKVEELFDDMNQWKPKVPRYITNIISIFIILYLILAVYFTIDFQEGATFDNISKFAILTNIVDIVGALIIFVAIFFYSFSENDKIYKLMMICCVILIVEAIISITITIAWNITATKAVYGLPFYVCLFAIPFYLIIMYTYRRGN